MSPINWVPVQSDMTINGFVNEYGTSDVGIWFTYYGFIWVYGDFRFNGLSERIIQLTLFTGTLPGDGPQCPSPGHSRGRVPAAGQQGWISRRHSDMGTNWR